ncbi:MAG: hypothetical protein IPK82_25110 [Polyangiaceae bacterium]|nr:hypothetical protein [Polyangiaceae bacterium]
MTARLVEKDRVNPLDLGDWANVQGPDARARFLENVEAVFRVAATTTHYVKVNCATNRPIQLNGNWEFRDVVVLDALGPLPSGGGVQIDTGTLWIKNASRTALLGFAAASVPNSTEAREHWLLHDGYSTISPFEVLLEDLPSSDPSVDTPRFVDLVNRRVVEGDALVIGTCTYYTTYPVAQP